MEKIFHSQVELGAASFYIVFQLRDKVVEIFYQTAFPDMFRSNFKLGFNQKQTFTCGWHQLCDIGQYLSQRDKAQIRHSNVKWHELRFQRSDFLFKLSGIHLVQVDAFHGHHSMVCSQTGV